MSYDVTLHLKTGSPTAPLFPEHGTSPLVVIFLATYNGAAFLAEQLASIQAQTHTHWRIIVSDDGSTDATVSILKQFQSQIGPDRLQILDGPHRGFAANFLELACIADTESDFFAFCDQDDLWHPTHLERAISSLTASPAHCPALHCGRTRLVDEQGRYIGLSPLFSKEPSFANALVQSLAGGNTMVFNRAAHRLLADAGRLAVVSHDWWLYLLVTGSGGTVQYDHVPSIDYRQHGANIVGANSRLSDRLFRIRRMFAGQFKHWNSLNIQALQASLHCLSPDNQAMLQLFAQARQKALPARLHGLIRTGVYRQTLLGTLGLWAASLLGKL